MVIDKFLRTNEFQQGLKIRGIYGYDFGFYIKKNTLKTNFQSALD